MDNVEDNSRKTLLAAWSNDAREERRREGHLSRSPLEAASFRAGTMYAETQFFIDNLRMNSAK